VAADLEGGVAEGDVEVVVDAAVEEVAVEVEEVSKLFSFSLFSHNGSNANILSGGGCGGGGA